MNKLKYWWNDYKKLDKIDVTYSFHSMSRNQIFSKNETILPDKLIIIDYGFDKSFKLDEIFEDRYRKYFNKRANELLILYQKKQLFQMNNGIIETGKYIISCSWSIYPKYKDTTYKEVKEAKVIL